MTVCLNITLSRREFFPWRGREAMTIFAIKAVILFLLILGPGALHAAYAVYMPKNLLGNWLFK